MIRHARTNAAFTLVEPKRSAFTLVELSIVLVILGLLVGGVLAGQSLIRAAELRSVTTQYNQYLAATYSFRDKYFALPGDMTNAQSFWGVAHATPATCITTASTSALTCNGNGDGSINLSTGSNELFRFWQHLANAGLIEGSYSGIRQGTTDWSSTSANSPVGKMSSSLWHTSNWATQSGLPYLFNGTYNNILVVGAIFANGDPTGALLKPEELWNIDTKIDDGKPAIGKLVVRAPGGLSTCSTTTSDNPATLTADYLLTNSAVACAATFRQAF